MSKSASSRPETPHCCEEHKTPIARDRSLARYLVDDGLFNMTGGSYNFIKVPYAAPHATRRVHHILLPYGGSSFSLSATASTTARESSLTISHSSESLKNSAGTLPASPFGYRVGM